MERFWQKLGYFGEKNSLYANQTYLPKFFYHNLLIVYQRHN